MAVLAAPFTCLAVVLIALPFGAKAGRHNVFVGVASSIFLPAWIFCFATALGRLRSGRILAARRSRVAAECRLRRGWTPSASPYALKQSANAFKLEQPIENQQP